jgi:addiction module HigA family antidote
MSRVRARMHPGKVLREEFMEPLQLSASELAAALDVTPNRITAIIDDGQRGTLTSDIALRLARRFRTSPQFWLGLQNAYDLAVAQAEIGAEIEARVQPLPA